MQARISHASRYAQAHPRVDRAARVHIKTVKNFRRVLTPALETPSHIDNGSVVSPAAESQPSPAPISFDELSDILRMVNATDIVELELKSTNFHLAVKKREAIVASEYVQVSHAAPASLAPAPVFAAAPAAPTPVSAPPPPAPAAPAAPAKVEGVEVVSPMAGSFYHRPAPGEPPFVKVGDKVKKGQCVGIIEAMKLMNEIEAEVSGEVVKILVDSGMPVVPGQLLMVIKP